MTSNAAPIRFRTILTAAIIIGLAAAVATGFALSDDRLRGYGLYHGLIEVTARIQGHQAALPPVATRCANCHDADQTNAAGPKAIAALTADALLNPTSRRGGPASSYTRESFCSLLATGIDPAFVIIDRSMPRFEVSDADCTALWTYVSQR